MLLIKLSSSRGESFPCAPAWSWFGSWREVVGKRASTGGIIERRGYSALSYTEQVFLLCSSVIMGDCAVVFTGRRTERAICRTSHCRRLFYFENTWFRVPREQHRRREKRTERLAVLGPLTVGWASFWHGGRGARGAGGRTVFDGGVPAGKRAGGGEKTPAGPGKQAPRGPCRIASGPRADRARDHAPGVPSQCVSNTGGPRRARRTLSIRPSGKIRPRGRPPCIASHGRDGAPGHRFVSCYRLSCDPRAPRRPGEAPPGRHPRARPAAGHKAGGAEG